MTAEELRTLATSTLDGLLQRRPILVATLPQDEKRLLLALRDYWQQAQEYSLKELLAYFER